MRVHQPFAMIGVDAAEISFIRQHLRELKNFSRIFQSGRHIELYSQADLIAGAVWPSFFTGKDVGVHGFYQIMAWDPATMRLRRVTPEWLPLEPFWREMAREGLATIAVDVPMTFPPRDDSAVEIIGWGSHQGLSDFEVRPRRLAGELDRRFGRRSLGMEVPVEDRAGRSARAQRDRIRRDLIASAKRKSELIRWIAATQRWDLLLAVFGEAHRGGHVLWPSDEAVPKDWLLEVYAAVDVAVGEVLECVRARGGRVGLFALHGMGSNNSQRHFLDQIVRRVNRSWCLQPGIASLRAASAAPAGRPNGLKLLRDRLPKPAKSMISRFIPRTVKDILVSRLYSAHDWRVTPAINLKTDGNGYIRLNIRDRERYGLLEPGSGVEKFLDALREGLFSFKSEYGRPLVEGFHLTREIASGDRLSHLPDVVITRKDQPAQICKVRSPTLGEVTGRPDLWRGGYHRGTGFLVLLDPQYGNRADYPQRMKVSDLVPMIRSALQGQ